MVTEVESRQVFPVFLNVTIAADGNTSADESWVHLHEYYTVHGANILFGGDGTLKIEWKVTAHPDDTLADFTEFLTGLASSDSPFLQPLALDPGAWIKFRGTETGKADSITGFYLYFIQTCGKLR